MGLHIRGFAKNDGVSAGGDHHPLTKFTFQVQIAAKINGNYIIEGRTDDVVLTSNGEKINPDVIEAIINLPSVERFSRISLSLPVLILKEIRKFLLFFLRECGSIDNLH